MIRFVVLIACISWLSSPACAQVATGPIFPIGDVPWDDVQVSADDTAAAVGSTFEVAIHADTTEGVEEILYTLQWHSDVLSLEGWRAGAAMEAYDQEADCDVFVYPDDEGSSGADVMPPDDIEIAFVETIFYEDEFDTEEYGTEILILEFKVETENAEETDLLVADLWGNLSWATVELVEADPLLRADVNADETRSLLDVLVILGYLYGDGSIDCERAADVDDDGSIGLDDTIDIMNGLFNDGELPEDVCATDLTEDDLTCDESGCE